MSANVVPLKRLASIMPSNVDKHSVEGEQPVRLCNYVDVYKNERITEAMDFMEATATDAQIDRFTLKANDVIVTKDSEEPTDIGIPAYVPSDLPGVVCGYHLAVLRPDQGRLHGGYLHWALQSGEVQAYYATAATGISRYALGIQDLGMTPVHVPSVPEQERIANFLDEQTARIDALIAEKERLLQSLDELRDATCRSAFTRGLVSKTPLVESGEQFLGEIPVHWKVLPWKRLGYFTGGAGFPIEYQGVTTEELPFFKVKDLDAADLLHPLTETDNTVSRETATKLRANVFPVGTLTFAKVGAALLLMRVRRLGVPGCLDNNMMAFIPDQAVVDPLFAQLALGLLPLDWLVNPGAVPSVSASQVGEVKVALPALNEQRQIAAYVQSKFAEFAGVRSHLHEHIGRLREYRSSLISTAVTGQLDLSTFKAAA